MTVPGLQHIERENLGERVYAQLKSALLSGSFEPGHRMRIRALAETLGTSPTPVRDALNRLVAERVLEFEASGSAVVPLMSKERFEHVVAVRANLEGMAAAEAAVRASPADLEELDRRLAELIDRVEHRNLNDYLERHRAFHFCIYRCSRNPVLVETIESLWLQCGPVLNLVVPRYVLAGTGSSFHRAVTKAIRQYDANAARDAVSGDIIEAGRFFLGLAGSDGYIRRPAEPA